MTGDLWEPGDKKGWHAPITNYGRLKESAQEHKARLAADRQRHKLARLAEMSCPERQRLDREKARQAGKREMERQERKAVAADRDLRHLTEKTEELHISRCRNDRAGLGSMRRERADRAGPAAARRDAESAALATLTAVLEGCGLGALTAAAACCGQSTGFYLLRCGRLRDQQDCIEGISGTWAIGVLYDLQTDVGYYINTLDFEGCDAFAECVSGQVDARVDSSTS